MCIRDSNIDAWKRSEMKNEDFISEYIKGMAIDSVWKQGMFATNKDALSQLRKGVDVRGNNLSPMVWNLADPSFRMPDPSGLSVRFHLYHKTLKV